MKSEHKYRCLLDSFFGSSIDQQIISIYRDRDKVEKVAEFKLALELGDLSINKVLTRQQFRKLSEIGVKVPREFLPR